MFNVNHLADTYLEVEYHSPTAELNKNIAEYEYWIKFVRGWKRDIATADTLRALRAWKESLKKPVRTKAEKDSREHLQSFLKHFYHGLINYRGEVDQQRFIRCKEHGRQLWTEQRSFGYCGPIFYVELKCGCCPPHLQDHSQDVPEDMYEV